MQELILEEKTTLSPVMKEIYRRLRTNLEFTGIENKVICLTSCMENDGKSSVSFNLAKILAENDKRVLFIDADIEGMKSKDSMRLITARLMPVASESCC